MRTLLVSILLLWPAVRLTATETTPVGQPIPFSHKQHADTAHLKCDDCHKLAPSGEVVSIPMGKSCMACHLQIDSNSPAIKDLKAYVDETQPVPWVRVYEIPSFVEFSHKTHLDAGTKCTTCHGPVATRDYLWRETDLSMGGCLSCHRAKAANTDCHTCHNLE
ncbi:MAG: cytochrome c family protein [Acidobacteriota bacterium]|nr:cytochrome c family protein [Acidobacteriota bacterium]